MSRPLTMKKESIQVSFKDSCSINSVYLNPFSNFFRQENASRRDQKTRKEKARQKRTTPTQLQVS